MKLLLDTHVWIWSETASARLSPEVVAALRDENNERWLSPVSVWELVLLVQKGRFRVNCGIAEWVGRARSGAPWMDAPLTVAVVLRAAGFEMHRDPADRWLAATAVEYGLTLVTADRKLIEWGGVPVLAA